MTLAPSRPFIARLAATIILAAGLGACATSTMPTAPTPTIEPAMAPPPPPVAVNTREGLTPPFMAGKTIVRVGLLLPFSTRSQDAQALYDAAELALFDHGDSTTLLLPRDPGGDDSSGRIAAAALMKDGADIIVGPVLKESVVAVAGPARSARVPIIAFSTDNTIAGNGIYLLSFPLEEEVSRIVEYAVSRGIRSFAILAPENEYGRRVDQALRRNAAKRGAAVVAEQFYARTERDAAAAAMSLAPRAKATGAQAVLIPESGAVLRAAAPGLLQGGLDLSRVKLLGTGAWASPETGREPTLAGGWYAAPDPAARVDFANRYKAVYGRAPTRLASLSYDAVAIAALLSRQGGGSALTRAAIENPQGYAGADGVFRFRGDGSIERNLAVLEVHPSGATVVAPAAKRFPSAGS